MYATTPSSSLASSGLAVLLLRWALACTERDHSPSAATKTSSQLLKLTVIFPPSFSAARTPTFATLVHSRSARSHHHGVRLYPCPRTAAFPCTIYRGSCLTTHTYNQLPAASRASSNCSRSLSRAASRNARSATTMVASSLSMRRWRSTSSSCVRALREPRHNCNNPVPYHRSMHPHSVPACLCRWPFASLEKALVARQCQ